MKKIKEKYELAKSAKVGEECICPSCGTQFEKTNYQQAFCKTKKGTKCKDKYWNTVTPEKRNNTTRISPANAAYSCMQYEIRNAQPKRDNRPIWEKWELGMMMTGTSMMVVVEELISINANT